MISCQCHDTRAGAGYLVSLGNQSEETQVCTIATIIAIVNAITKADVTSISSGSWKCWSKRHLDWRQYVPRQVSHNY